VVVLLLPLLAGSARADHAPWEFSWTVSPTDLDSAVGTGSIKLSPAAGTGSGNSDIVAANLEALSSADPATPDSFTDAGYVLTLHLTDQWSGESGSLTFGGLFSGTLSAAAVDIENVFVGEVTQELLLGGRTYSMTLDAYTPPGLPGSSNLGALGGTLTVSGPDRGLPPVQPAPEPSGMVLAALGLSSLGLRWWRGTGSRHAA
jgi:hypothetical protein